MQRNMTATFRKAAAVAMEPYKGKILTPIKAQFNTNS